MHAGSGFLTECSHDEICQQVRLSASLLAAMTKPSAPEVLTDLLADLLMLKVPHN